MNHFSGTSQKFQEWILEFLGSPREIHSKGAKYTRLFFSAESVTTDEDKSTPYLVDDDCSKVNSSLTSHEHYVQHLVNKNKKLKQKQIELENKITSNFIEHLLKDDKTCCHYNKTPKSIIIHLP